VLNVALDTGLNLAPELNLARAKQLLLFAIIASFCHFFGTFVVLDSAEMSAAPILISKGSKYWQK